MALAIINKSQSVLSLNQGRLNPGGIFWVLDHFRSDKDAYRDLILQRFMSSGIVTIEDLDREAHMRIPGLIKAANEARAAELARMAEEQTARLHGEVREREHQAFVDQARRTAQEMLDRDVVKPPTAQPGTFDADVSALFEEHRKQRIARAIAERQAKPAEEPPAEEMFAEVAAQAVIDGPMEAFDPEAVEPEPDGMFGGNEFFGVVPDVIEPVEPEPPALEYRLEDIDDESLRRVLDAFEVKGRKRIRSREKLLQAVRGLELDINDVVKLLSDEQE